MKKLAIILMTLFLTILSIDIVNAEVNRSFNIEYLKDDNKVMQEYGGTVNVKIYYYNIDGDTKPSIVLYKGFSKDDNKVKIKDFVSGQEGNKYYIEKKLTAGLYYFEVYYSGSSDYVKKHFYIDGSEKSVTYELGLSEFEAFNYQENVVNMPTDQVINNFYNYNNIKEEYKEELVTPSFTNEKYINNIRGFMNNNDMCDFVDSLNSKYLYTFYPFDISANSNRTPVLVFTKDKYDIDISFERMAKLINVNANGREILLINGGQHGNEPAGIEGALQFCYDLCGQYGENILDDFAAIVVIPCISVDNNQRFSRTYDDGCNSNRDLLKLEHESSINFVYAYNLLKPTIYISCHEDNEYNTVDSSDNSIADIHSLSYDSLLTSNSPIIDTNGLANGSSKLKDNLTYEILNNVINQANKDGFICEHYPIPSYFGCCETAYAMARGSFSFLIEATRIWAGKANYDYAVNETTYAIKNLIKEIIKQNEGDKTISELVKEGRENAKVTSEKDMTYFILKMAKNTQGEDSYPSVYVNGTYKDKDAKKVWKAFDEVKSVRSLPLSYVIDGNAINIDEILVFLEMHGIKYNFIKPGTTRSLRKYVITESELGPTEPSVKIEKSANVKFENGAYEIPLNNSDAYLIGYLFEPDSYVDGKNKLKNSMYEMELIHNNELYRNDNDFNINNNYLINVYQDKNMPIFNVASTSKINNSYILVKGNKENSLDFEINYYENDILADSNIDVSIDISNFDNNKLAIEKINDDGSTKAISSKIKDGYLIFTMNGNGHYQFTEKNSSIWYVIGGGVIVAGLILGKLFKKKK